MYVSQYVFLLWLGLYAEVPRPHGSGHGPLRFGWSCLYKHICIYIYMVYGRGSFIRFPGNRSTRLWLWVQLWVRISSRTTPRKKSLWGSEIGRFIGFCMLDSLLECFWLDRSAFLLVCAVNVRFQANKINTTYKQPRNLALDSQPQPLRWHDWWANRCPIRRSACLCVTQSFACTNPKYWMSRCRICKYIYIYI